MLVAECLSESYFVFLKKLVDNIFTFPNIDTSPFCGLMESRNDREENTQGLQNIIS